MRYTRFPLPLFIKCIVSLLVILSTDGLSASLSKSFFRVTKGYKLTQGTQLKNFYYKNNTVTLCSLLCSGGCGSATYSPKHKTCITFAEKFYESKISWIRDPEWVALYREEPIQHADWTMVFRAQKEINIPLFGVWNATGQHDDSPLSTGVLNGCYRLDNLGGCKQHFRSSILDNWKNITEVKFSVYVNGSEVSYIVFDGTSTTRDSWFQRSNILRSSWPLIKIDLLIQDFSIVGFTANLNKRRFVICGGYFNCYTDTSYFLAIDQTWDGCETEWSINVINYPVFIYSTNIGLALLSSFIKEYRVADVMAVFVKF